MPALSRELLQKVPTNEAHKIALQRWKENHSLVQL